MRRIRVIPVLLIHEGGLVKSEKFSKYKYVGDPMNAVRIFNEKEIDEIVILDIDATREKRGPDMKMIKQIAEEAFIPLAYGGGISTMGQVEQLFSMGVEKVIFNLQAFENKGLLTEAAKRVGSQSVVASIDVKKNWLGKRRVYLKNGTQSTGKSPEEYARELEDAGAGEIFLNSIDRDGMYTGYDLQLLKDVSTVVSIPVIICGGASGFDDFVKAITYGASALAAGSLFVFQRPHRAVLISYPTQQDLKEKLFKLIN